MAAFPGRLPGGASPRDERRRSELEELLNYSLPQNRGFGVTNFAEAARDGILKAMFLVGDSPNLTNGNLGDAVDRAAGVGIPGGHGMRFCRRLLGSPM